MAKIVVARYRTGFTSVVLLYVVLIIVTWSLTDAQSKRPTLLTKSGSIATLTEVGIRESDARTATRLSYGLDGLSYLGAVLALPVIYGVIARAAVVYSLRTSESKKLNARQLFSLADRRYVRDFNTSAYTGLAFFASILILVAFIQPIVRGSMVNIEWNEYPVEGWLPKDSVLDGPSPPRDDWQSPDTGWEGKVIGLSPTHFNIQNLSDMNVLTSTRQAIIGSRANEWRQNAWLEPRDQIYFATSLPRANMLTGLARQLALRLHTNYTGCTEQDGASYHPPSTSCKGVSFPYRYQDESIDICVEGDGTASNGFNPYQDDNWHYSPWKVTGNDMQVINEVMYINMTEGISEEWVSTTLYKCEATTSLGYFELGNDHNNQTFGGLIENFADYVRRNMSGRVYMDNETSISTVRYDYPESRYLDRFDDRIWNDRRSAPGPLLITAHSLFGNGSFYDLVQRATDAEDDPYKIVLSKSCPFPFQRVLGIRNCNWDWSSPSRWARYANQAIQDLLDDILVRDYYNGLVTSALYMANKAVLDGAITDQLLRNDDDEPSRRAYRIWSSGVRPNGLPLRQFEISQTAFIVITILLALQTLGIIAFLVYIHRVPTWTETLDALAIARIAFQLKDDNLLRQMGLREPKDGERKKLTEINALVGLEEPAIPLGDMSSSTAATSTSPERPLPPPPSATPSLTDHDAPSHHSPVPAVSIESSRDMGMSAIPIDTQTIDTEHSPENNHNNNTTPTAAAPLHPRISLDIGDDMLSPNDHDDHDGPHLPPAYTPRTAGGSEHGLEPPSYLHALSGNELRVGAHGLVTRRRPVTSEDIWV